MSDIKLDQVPDSDAKRDAVHVSVIPLEAGEDLNPGDRISINGSLAFKDDNYAIAIVSPFLSGKVEKWTRFWALMLPGQVSNLRHSWEHPSIPEDTNFSMEDDDENYSCRGCY